MRAIPSVAAALLLLALPTAPATEGNVAWLADQLGLAPSGLPATGHVELWTLGPAGWSRASHELPAEDFAALASTAATAQGVPATPHFIGVGFDAGAGFGVGWSGYAGGPQEMACAEVATVETPLAVQPSPLSSGGQLNLTFHAALPDDALFRTGVAAMQMQVLPAPGQPAMVSDIFAVEADVDVGGYAVTGCAMSFTLRLTFVVFAGDGTLRG